MTTLVVQTEKDRRREFSAKFDRFLGFVQATVLGIIAVPLIALTMPLIWFEERRGGYYIREQDRWEDTHRQDNYFYPEKKHGTTATENKKLVHNHEKQSSDDGKRDDVDLHNNKNQNRNQNQNQNQNEKKKDPNVPKGPPVPLAYEELWADLPKMKLVRDPTS
jgi:hypothetical protein